MARDVPTPCCGSFSVNIGEDLSCTEPGRILYFCTCPRCGTAFGEKADSRAEALYNFDDACVKAWRRNPNGYQNWMVSKPELREDVIRREKIRDGLGKSFNPKY